MKFEHTKVYNILNAIRGARNPMNSWDKMDSYEVLDPKTQDNDVVCIIGPNDMKLLKMLIGADNAKDAVGTPNAKFRRQILVSVDITAPLCFWKEYDTYKVGTVANSTSTMHKLASTPITRDCFEKNPFGEEYDLPDELINYLENLRQEYLKARDDEKSLMEKKHKALWYKLIYSLPDSWLQTRTVTLNYEVLANIAFWRRNHKQNCWSGKDNPSMDNMMKWISQLPYASDLIFTY